MYLDGCQSSKSHSGFFQAMRDDVCDLDSQINNQHYLNKDFENEDISPWLLDESENGDGWQWAIEEISKPFEEGNPAPFPSSEGMDLSGLHHLRLKRTGPFFGVAGLRSPTFTAYPGDEIQFSYWIRSRFSNFNNIQVG